jgi:hypothetical protein
MAKVAPGDFTRVLRDRFSVFVSQRVDRPSALSEVIRLVRQRGLTAFAFGGIPRGLLHHGGLYQPRDLDLVFDDNHFEFFESAFSEFIQRRNSYGGLKLRIQGMAVDAWPLGATWAFRTGLCSEPSFEKLPLTTFLNVDGVVVELAPEKGKARRIYEAGFFSAWKQRVLDINLRDNLHPSVCVARTLSIAERFGFRISHDLAAYVWEMLTTIPMEELLSGQANHYGQVSYSADKLGILRQSLAEYISSSSLLPFSLFPVVIDQMELPFTEEFAAEAGLGTDRSWANDQASTLVCDA